MRFAGTSLAIMTLLCGAVAVDAQTESDSPLSEATKKTSKLDSYTFTMLIEVEGSPMPMDPFEFEGKHSGNVTFLTGEVMGQEVEMYKEGDTIVGLNDEGDWEASPTMGMGGGASGMMNAPHQELGKLDGKLDDVKKLKERDDLDGKPCDVYTGTLSSDNAQEMLGNPAMAMMDADISGTIKLWVAKSGIILKIALNIDIAMDFQGNEMEMTVVRTTTLSKLGKTKIDIPDEVREIFTEEADSDDSEKKGDEDY